MKNSAEDKMRPFCFWKHALACMYLIHEQRGFNNTKKETTIFSWLYLLEIICGSEEMFVLTIDNTIVGMSGFSNGSHRKLHWKLAFLILFAVVWIFYDRNIFSTYKIYNFYRPYLRLCDGELSILVVNKKYRGYGYGKKLFEKACSAAASFGHKKILICTYDRYCDVSFYEAMGCGLFTSFMDPDPDDSTHCRIYMRNVCQTKASAPVFLELNPMDEYTILENLKSCYLRICMVYPRITFSDKETVVFTELPKLLQLYSYFAEMVLNRLTYIADKEFYPYLITLKNALDDVVVDDDGLSVNPFQYNEKQIREIKVVVSLMSLNPKTNMLLGSVRQSLIETADTWACPYLLTHDVNGNGSVSETVVVDLLKKINCPKLVGSGKCSCRYTAFSTCILRDSTASEFKGRYAFLLSKD